METLYMVCAVAGGTVLVIQTVLTVLGGSTDTDLGDVGGGADGGFHGHAGGFDAGADAGMDGAHVHHEFSAQDLAASDAHQATYFKVLSFQTLVAFVTFFGLAGLAALKGELPLLASLGIAVATGSVALYIVAYLMSTLARLQSRGNVNLQNAIGQVGKVYLRIPAERSGEGKVSLVVQGRLMECKAATAGPEIPTGTEVQVVGTLGPSTVDVVPLKRS
jgi:membrane protein implicated in regulation of membrane protease activity